jgi:hypothetical protein
VYYLTCIEALLYFVHFDAILKCIVKSRQYFAMPTQNIIVEQLKVYFQAAEYVVDEKYISQFFI